MRNKEQEPTQINDIFNIYFSASNKHFSYGCNFQKNYFILGKFKDLGTTATKEECLEKVINSYPYAPGVQWQNRKCYAKWYDINEYGRKWKPYESWKASIMGDTYACLFEGIYHTSTIETLS